MSNEGEESPYAALVAIGVRESIAKGTQFISEREPGGRIYIILSGRVRAFTRTDANRELTIGVFSSGDYVGELSLDGRDRVSSIEAIEHTECAVVTNEQMLDYIAQRPEFAIDVIFRIIGRARAAVNNARRLALEDNYSRLSQLLTELSEQTQDSSEPGNVLATHKDIAFRIGCTREMVSRLLKDLEVGGFIEVGRGSIRVLKRLPKAW